MTSMRLIRTAKTGYIILSLMLCAMGLLLMLKPDVSVKAIGIIAGCVLIAFGIIKLIGYFSKDLYRLAFQFDLAFGLLLLALGVVVLLRTSLAMGPCASYWGWRSSRMACSRFRSPLTPAVSGWAAGGLSWRWRCWLAWPVP